MDSALSSATIGQVRRNAAAAAQRRPGPAAQLRLLHTRRARRPFPPICRTRQARAWLALLRDRRQSFAACHGAGGSRRVASENRFRADADLDPNGRELAETERLFLRPPEQGKIDPSGEGHNAQICRMAAFNDRLDYPWRQEPERHQPPHRSAIDTFPPCELVNRSYVARDQVVRPSSGAGDRLEQRKINSAGTGVALKHHTHLDTSPLHLHGDESGESKVAYARAVAIVGREKWHLDRDSDTVAAKLYPFGLFGERRWGSAVRAAFRSTLQWT
jgi:hypothetical protein